jgi:hypothetical protein
MTSALTPEDFDDLYDYIRLQVAAGFAPVEAITEDAVEAFVETSTEVTALRNAARAIADQALTDHRADQAAWSAPTDCDRIDAAFAELELAGIVARQHFSCCGTCGADEIHDEIHIAAASGRQTRGFTFFHVQDTEQAIAGESLYLSYGSATKNKAESVAIGHEVVAALGRHGLSPSWNGKIVHRIALPVTWQRRRP